MNSFGTTSSLILFARFPLACLLAFLPSHVLLVLAFSSYMLEF
jgi:hypothetical protein